VQNSYGAQQVVGSNGSIQQGIGNVEARTRVENGKIVTDVGQNIVDAKGNDISGLTKHEARVDENGNVVTEQGAHHTHVDAQGHPLHHPVNLATITPGAAAGTLKGLSGADLARLQEKAMSAMRAAKANPATAAAAQQAIDLAEQAFKSQGVALHLPRV